MNDLELDLRHNLVCTISLNESIHCCQIHRCNVSWWANNLYSVWTTITLTFNVFLSFFTDKCAPAQSCLYHTFGQINVVLPNSQKIVSFSVFKFVSMWNHLTLTFRVILYLVLSTSPWHCPQLIVNNLNRCHVFKCIDIIYHGEILTSM